ncbi:MAG TPA: hypothetical protein VF266_23500 [Thermoanaerobaculia bacterium]
MQIILIVALAILVWMAWAIDAYGMVSAFILTFPTSLPPLLWLDGQRRCIDRKDERAGARSKGHILMRTTTRPECPCVPCIDRELALCEDFIVEHKPIADKIGEKFTDEFRRLLSITPQYTFAEQMMQLEAFSAASAEEQWAILRRYAVDQKEATDEEFGAAIDELHEMDALIAEADRHLAGVAAAPDEKAQQVSG